MTNPRNAQPSFPAAIKAAIADGAARLGAALEYLEWPNGQGDAPCNELNALINVQGRLSLLMPQFHFYSEARADDRGRVDMVACNNELALAIEAKSFGKINERSNSLADDIVRLRRFKPAYYTAHGREVKDWWTLADQRWGLVLITSFRGESVREAWEEPNAAIAMDHLDKYRSKDDKPRSDGTGFMALHAIPDMERFASPISLGDRWGDEGRGWLLCGALPL